MQEHTPYSIHTCFHYTAFAAVHHLIISWRPFFTTVPNHPLNQSFAPSRCVRIPVFFGEQKLEHCCRSTNLSLPPFGCFFGATKSVAATCLKSPNLAFVERNVKHFFTCFFCLLFSISMCVCVCVSGFLTFDVWKNMSCVQNRMNTMESKQSP